MIFSPFGGDRRIWLAATLVLVLVCREPAPAKEAALAGEPLPARDSP